MDLDMGRSFLASWVGANDCYAANVTLSPAERRLQAIFFFPLEVLDFTRVRQLRAPLAARVPGAG